MKWPNLDWLLASIEQVVEKKLGGYSEAAPEVKKQRKYTGVDGKTHITDDELRELLKKKCSTLAAAFRKFDKNADGCVNKGEFLTVLRGIGVDFPPAIMNKLWDMADEDGSGNLHYQEFARKFANYKHTASMHRHVALKSEADAKA